jgi:hypothetical protein
VPDYDKEPQVHVGEIRRTRTDELPYIGVGEPEEESDIRTAQRQNIVANPLMNIFAVAAHYNQPINTKKTLNDEEKRRKNFERNLNKLALFAYEANEGIDMLENGQNPFLEEVDVMLQEIDRASMSFPSFGQTPQQDQLSMRRDSGYLE